MAASLFLPSEDGETGLLLFLSLKDCARRSGTTLVTIRVRPRPGNYFQVLSHHQVRQISKSLRLSLGKSDIK